MHSAPMRPVSALPYPTRQDERLNDFDYVVGNVIGRLRGSTGILTGLRLRWVLWRTLRAEKTIAALSDTALDRAVAEQRCRFARDGLAGTSLAQAAALLRDVMRRELGLRPHDVQMRATIGLLDGNMVEMATGEGKSLVAALTASIGALAGMPTHVVTVNDYLAERDADSMAGFFSRIGLTSGCILHDATPQQRQQIYQRDIVYASNKEIAFDYLRDQLKIGTDTGPIQAKLRRLRADMDDPPVMRGLHFAVIDEADSVLIDDARTPLILSRETDAASEAEWAAATFSLAEKLDPDIHFKPDDTERRIELTEPGKTRLEELAEDYGPEFRNRVQREQAVQQALVAQRYFKNGDQYVVQDGKIVIVDEYTGRLMPERSWNDGLHQLVEYLEGQDITGRKITLARTSYQKFFRQYLRLSGMSGTAREVKGEISAVYRLITVMLPTRLRTRLTWLGTRICRDEPGKLDQLVARVRAATQAGRPVLVGTRTVAASETISEAFHKAELDHDVLNAMTSSEEASVIARAGEAARVTVATNMAGRGVHVDISDSVAKAGGLHVILTERHDSARIDRQLIGRTARQGQPGSAEAILALDDTLLKSVRAPLLRSLARVPGFVGQICGKLLFRRAQHRTETLNAQARRTLLKLDRGLDRLMAFSGRPD